MVVAQSDVTTIKVTSCSINTKAFFEVDLSNNSRASQVQDSENYEAKERVINLQT